MKAERELLWSAQLGANATSEIYVYSSTQQSNHRMQLLFRVPCVYIHMHILERVFDANIPVHPWTNPLSRAYLHDYIFISRSCHRYGPFRSMRVCMLYPTMHGSHCQRKRKLIIQKTNE
jgi:hypothetical protein